MFCQVCISEYTLFLDQCPVCDSKIRKKKISSGSKCFIADNAIEKLLSFAQPHLVEKWEEKQANDASWIRSKKLDISEIKISDKEPMLIDARDTE